MVASISSYIPSINTILPFNMAYTKKYIHLLLLVDITTKFSPLLALIHVDPYNYGSINNGHLLQLDIIDAFSSDIVSVGNYSFFHFAISESLVNILSGLIPSVIGIYLFIISGYQTVYHKSNLNLILNAPLYDTNAEPNNASPIIVNVLFYNLLTFSPHLLFSPDKPLTNVSAAFNLLIQAFASASTFYFLVSASSNFLLSTSTFSFNNLTLSFISFNYADFISNSFVALSQLSSNGFTNLVILFTSNIFNAHYDILAAA